jgi:class 3 adenylate cyclase/tetratricopeptide (TPR) repeat protein
MASNRRDAKFCRVCGYPLLGLPAELSPTAAAAQPIGASDERDLDPSGVEGERKQVTVLFADIKGSMELIAFRDPEDARKILDPVLDSMMTAVNSFGGTVNRSSGDGIMALFGAPTALEDHALRACQAALRIQDLLRRLVSENRWGPNVDVNVRVGLNSGEVIVHHIQNQLRVDYSATGHAVHLAARMEQLARPGTILISESTFKACPGMLDVTPLGYMPVKGLPEAQRVFELNGVSATATRLEMAERAGVLSRFVNRETERAVLDRAAQKALQGRGQVVALVGEPGVGKSRLTYELSNTEWAGQFFRQDARALSYGSRSAFMPIIALLRSYMGIRLGDPASDIVDRVSQKLKELDADSGEAQPALLWLLGVTGYSEEWEALDPQIKRERLLAALKRLFISQSRTRPLLLLFEDLHWADVESQAMLDVLVDAIPSERILLVVTYRDEYAHEWSNRPHYALINVSPLAPSSAGEFLDDLLGSDASLVPLKVALAARTAGNPFFLEESVRALVETGAVGAGTYRVEKPVADVDIAPSVQAVLAARIDRLPAEDKRLLQAASVIGQDVPFDVLKEVVGIEPSELDNILARLQLANFLDKGKTLPLTYAFKHALTHDVAYASLLREQRKLIHSRALHAVERVYAGHLGEQLEILARHAQRAEVWDKAIAYLRQAGNASARRSSFKEAELWYRSAIEAWNHLPESRAKSELGFDLRMDLYIPVLTYGDITPVFEVLESAENLAAAIPDNDRLSRVAGCLGQACWWIADYPRALELAKRALSFGPEGRALMTLAWTKSALGDFKGAKKHLEDLLALERAVPIGEAVRNGRPSTTVMALVWIVSCRGELGEFEEAIADAREAVRIAEEIDQPWSRAGAYYALGTILLRRRRFTEAIAVLEDGQRLCSEYLIPGWATTTGWILGYAYALNGEPRRGADLLEQVVRDSTATRCNTRLSLRIAYLAEAELLDGKADRAAELAGQALQLAATYGERPAEGHVRRLLGDIVWRANADEAAAAGQYEQALAIAREYSMAPLEAQCMDGLRRLRARRGSGLEQPAAGDN